MKTESLPPPAKYPKVLVTGDYWHEEFRDFLEGFPCVTLVPIEHLDRMADEVYDLAVIVQSRPGTYSHNTIEAIKSRIGNTPLVAVLGSWCEGEKLSGNAWPGVIRVFWHQWKGRYDSFVEQLMREGITVWHAPRTSSPADRILKPHFSATPMATRCIGISAPNESRFCYLRDAIEALGWSAVGVPQETLGTDRLPPPNPICLEADSYSDDLAERIKQLQSRFPHANWIVILNFPRIDDVRALADHGIREVISKPFELNDLKSAIVRAVETKTESVSKQ